MTHHSRNKKNQGAIRQHLDIGGMRVGVEETFDEVLLNKRS